MGSLSRWRWRAAAWYLAAVCEGGIFPDFAVPVAVRGTITFNITDYKQFIKLNRLIDFNLDAFSKQIKDSVVKYTKNFVGNCPVDNGIPVIQIERKVVEVSDMVQSRLSGVFENDFGVNLKRFDICY